MGNWRRISQATDLPRAARFVPVALETSRGIIQSIAACAVDAEDCIHWYGVDGKKFEAKVLAWYNVPHFNQES